MVSKSELSRIIIFLQFIKFNSLKKIGKDSDSLFVGINKVRSEKVLFFFKFIIIYLNISIRITSKYKILKLKCL